MGGRPGAWPEEVCEPDTIAFSEGALAYLLASSVESTVILDSAPKLAREKTARTFFPPPVDPLASVVTPPPREPASISFAPLTFTPPSGVARVESRTLHTTRAAARASLALAAGVGIGMLAAMAIVGSHRDPAKTASPASHAVRSAVNERLAIDAALREKAVKKRRFVMLVRVGAPPASASAPAAPPSNLDALGDAQLGRPF